jgi:NADPH:quinone reductase-like Zn-dependent oxidoreductase
MKAVYIEQFGGPEVVRFGDLPDPAPGPGQVLVEVHAASVNGADWKVRAGTYASRGTPFTFPVVIGRDFSGVVGAVGTGVADLKAGDEVFGVLEAGRNGTYAEKIVVGASVIAKKPAGLPHANAAALALIGLTALAAIENCLKLQSGETILIQGGAGGVAGIAIQIAKHLGARVITTASGPNQPYVRSLGADQVIDYTTTDFTTAVSDCDAVLDTVGGDVALRSFKVLKPGGRAAFIASGVQAPTPERNDVTSLRPAATRARAPLERIMELYKAGAIAIPPIKEYALSDAAEALRISAARHLQGKLVIKVRD